MAARASTMENELDMIRKTPKEPHLKQIMHFKLFNFRFVVCTIILLLRKWQQSRDFPFISFFIQSISNEKLVADIFQLLVTLIFNFQELIDCHLFTIWFSVIFFLFLIRIILQFYNTIDRVIVSRENKKKSFI